MLTSAGKKGGLLLLLRHDPPELILFDSQSASKEGRHIKLFN